MKTKRIRFMFPLWIYELALGFGHQMSGWPYAWLIILTVLASIEFTFTSS